MIRFKRSWMFIGVLLTVVIFFVHYFLPPKKLLLYPSDSVITALYGFVDIETGRSSHWTDAAREDWICEYKRTHSYGCGWDIKWDPAFVNGIDMRSFDALEFSVRYEGDASRIRVSLRTFDEAYAQPGDVHSTKFLSVTVPVSELEAPFLVHLSEFSVANWWLRERNVRRQWSQPEFGNVVIVGVDFIEPGIHRARVDRIALVGRWIETETLLLFILAFWMAVFLIGGLLSFYRLYRKSQYERHLIALLEVRQHSLEEEKQSLRALSDIDPLTGIHNRAGLNAHVVRLFGTTGTSTELGMMLLDIDHFKRLNDIHGLDMGDRVLRALAAAIAANLREEDIFARWGGEEFIIICRNKTADALRHFAEKLREITAGYTFGGELELKITVSIGTTVAQRGERFDDVIFRLGTALHRAKEGGRDRVESEP